MIDLEQLLRIPFVEVDGGLDISPDGAHLAFAWNTTGQWQIYELGLGGSEIPLTASAGPGAQVCPKYSPDGSRLGYAVDLDGSENFHLFVQERRREATDSPTPQYRDLTPDIDYALQPNFSFSPNGGQIAFLADKTGCFSTYVMPLSGGDASLLLETGMPAWDVVWSPDGRHLAVMSEGSGQDYLIHIVPLDRSEAIPIALAADPINAHNPAWSPDGRRLAFRSDVPNGFFQIGIFDLRTRDILWLTTGDADCGAPQWSKDGTRLTYTRGHGASDRIVVQALDGAVREFQVEAGVHYRPHFTPDGNRVVFVFNSPRQPPDLWMLTPESGELRQMTDSMPAELEHSAFVLPQETTYPGLDGTPIPALLFRAANAAPGSPAVIVIHGGPNWHYQMEWHPVMSHLASKGLTVLAPNYRGSTGYGRKWQYASRFDLGGIDADDIAAGARFLREAGLADPARIAVTGQSHGGYLTMCCLTRYPDLWCAGSAVVPFLNWFTGHENSREDLQHWDIQNLGDPADNHDLWLERSPFFFLDKVAAPVQMICGENDPRCPASESIHARDRLEQLGKAVELVLYPGEGHSFRKTENIVNAEMRRVGFLDKALL